VKRAAERSRLYSVSVRPAAANSRGALAVILSTPAAATPR
jgi:hypothetical protein